MANTTYDARARSRPMTREEKKVILASSAGTIFEWYDFYLFGSLAAVIGRSSLRPSPKPHATSLPCWRLPRALSCARSVHWCSALWVT